MSATKLGMVVLIHLWIDGLQSVDFDWWRCFSQELFLMVGNTSGGSITTEVYMIILLIGVMVASSAY